MMVLRVGDAWSVGVGKRAPHGIRVSLLALHRLAGYRLKAYTFYPGSFLNRTLKERQNKARQGRASMMALT